ncbi:hypothetical protein [Ureibacillus aquaedulcis]|uniref:Uncharacterized protein n=1 Tax=Ureibacillus aquaedulcis TaxID=3058421 RepID=A0ABT8GNA1_9BACL|nr:hypothetical protein [Ureibacillus sp. BA0131]MDN4492892.1 hypothetical protein [Ureibacillus sp. BA0131]
MLLNGKADELKRYSKLNYVAEKFVEKAREVWEYSDLQIRCIYLISDLAKKGSGVFSIAYSSFKKMFEQRFNLKISLSTVRRFFALMEKLNLLSINEAKRKNEQQSANIYIIEQQHDEIENEHPIEQPSEHQNVSKETDNKQKPLTKELAVVKQEGRQDKVIFDLYLEYKQQGIDKKLFERVVSEVRVKNDVKNFGGYLRGALNNVIGHKETKSRVKDIMAFYSNTTVEKYSSTGSVAFYNWLEE